MNEPVSEPLSEWSFDTMRELAETDPAEFENVRRRIIEGTIGAQADPSLRQKLKQLQFRIDGIRRRHTVNGAMVEINALMWQHFEEMNQRLNREDPAPRPGEPANSGIHLVRDRNSRHR